MQEGRFSPKTCWVITQTGLTGTLNQCLGVSASLGLEPIIQEIELPLFVRKSTPYINFGLHSWAKKNFSPPHPDLVLASGRLAVAPSLWIKKQSPSTKVVFLQNPKWAHRQFDLIAAPAHDYLSGDNVIQTIGAANCITADSLKQSQEHFASMFQSMPAPRIAVMIGGKSRSHEMTRNDMERLIQQLTGLQASLMITASRRTGTDNLKRLQDALTDKENCFLWDGTGENPYHGMLGWADYIMVTEDSVSMCSDAASTGKPVYTLPLSGGSQKFDDFHRFMHSYGATRPFEGRLEHWEYPPLNDAQTIAEAIRHPGNPRD